MWVLVPHHYFGLGKRWVKQLWELLVFSDHIVDQSFGLRNISLHLLCFAERELRARCLINSLLYLLCFAGRELRAR